MPRAQLDGDPAVVSRVGAELRKLGVDLGAGPGRCRAVRALVSIDREGGLAVSILDGSRRTEGRIVSDPAVAAAWIDSWLRDDVDGISAPPSPEPPPVSAPAVSAPAVSAPAVSSPAAAAPPVAGMAPMRASPAAPGLLPPSLVETSARATVPPPLLSRVALSAAYEQAWSDDGAAASGVGAAACFRVGRACLGARALYLREGVRAVNLTAMSRTDVSLFATASTSIALGRMSLAPELGVGVGRRHTERVDCTFEPAPGGPGSDPNCDPTDPACMMMPLPEAPVCANPAGQVQVGDGLEAVSFTPRAAASLRLAVPLFDRVWLEGTATATLAPFGHNRPFPAAGPNGLPLVDEIALPGEPWGAFQLGIGLRLGAP